MYSRNLMKIINANQPASIEWSVQQVRRLAAIAGLQVILGDGETVANLRKGDMAIVFPENQGSLCGALILCPGNVPIVWHGGIEGNRLTYIPHIHNTVAYLFVDQEGKPLFDPVVHRAVEQALFKASGTQDYVVDLTESVVDMPVAPWTLLQVDDYGDDTHTFGYTYGMTEARKRAAKYIRKLADLVGFDVTLTAKS